VSNSMMMGYSRVAHRALPVHADMHVLSWEEVRLKLTINQRAAVVARKTLLSEVPHHLFDMRCMLQRAQIRPRVGSVAGGGPSLGRTQIVADARSLHQPEHDLLLAVHAQQMSAVQHKHGRVLLTGGRATRQI
ncbi:hypothetical protein PFISCL1PPCAC_18122, partial [Pristionchus fissidentatus]